MQPFIDTEEIWDYLNHAESTPQKVRSIIEKSLGKNRLNLAETATLINATDKDSVQLIKEGAKELEKKDLRKQDCTVCPVVRRQQMFQQLYLLRIQGFKHGTGAQNTLPR